MSYDGQIPRISACVSACVSCRGLEAGGGMPDIYIPSLPPSPRPDFCRDIYSLHLLAAGLPLPRGISLRF